MPKMLGSTHRSRSDSSSSSEAEGDHRDERLIPLVKNPLPKLKDGETDDELGEAPELEWMDGFFDLFFVSALGAYNDDHDLNTADDLGSYIAYFVVIWWMWVSQVRLDVRFPCDDVLHRVLKFTQLCMFAVLASYADGWSLSWFFQPSDWAATLEDWTTYGVGESEAQSALANQTKITTRAFQAVALVYIASRFLMLLQHLQLVWCFRKTPGYRVRLADHAPLVATSVSFLLSAFSYGFSTRQGKGFAVAKVTCLYFGIFAELVTAFVEARLPGHRSFNRTSIAGRFGLLTLIIMGEGVLKLTDVTRDVVADFSFNTVMYGQIFAAFLMVYLLFHIYFDGFGKHVRTGRLRGQAWQWMHFPAHLMIVFIFAGMQGSLVWTTINTSVADSVNTFDNAIASIQDGTYASNPNSSTFQQVSAQLTSYGLDWSGWAADLQDLWNNATATNDTTAYDSYFSSVYQLEAEVIQSLYSAVGVNADTKTDNLYQLLTSGLGPDQGVNGTTFWLYLEGLQTTAVGPVLYLGPVSGGFLVCTSILLLNSRSSLDVSGWIVPGARFVLGALLCLTGLLDIGPHGFDKLQADSLKAYLWAAHGWQLPSVVFVFVASVAIEYTLLYFTQGSRSPAWARRRVFGGGTAEQGQAYAAVEKQSPPHSPTRGDAIVLSGAVAGQDHSHSSKDLPRL